jgi:hypothetical protein
MPLPRSLESKSADPEHSYLGRQQTHQVSLKGPLKPEPFGPALSSKSLVIKLMDAGVSHNGSALRLAETMTGSPLT